MVSNARSTLDAWLIKEEEQRVEGKKERSISLKSLIEEFAKKISIPELKDSTKINYKLYEIFPEQQRAIIVTEKAKVASAIARALGGGKKRIIKTNWGNVISFETIWNSRYITIIPLRGHVMDYDVIEKYGGDWRNSDPLELIDPSSLRVIIKEKHIVNVIRKIASNSNLLILATDADEEGANIGLEIFEIVSEINRECKAVQMWFIMQLRLED